MGLFVGWVGDRCKDWSFFDLFDLFGRLGLLFLGKYVFIGGIGLLLDLDYGIWFCYYVGEKWSGSWNYRE